MCKRRASVEDVTGKTELFRLLRKCRMYMQIQR
jgi:hypothetical protein